MTKTNPPENNPLPEFEAYLADLALKRLKAGNKRFVENRVGQTRSHEYQDLRPVLVEAQKPFAIILSCSDSRAPSEIIFDQGLGDLFVIRVAGNIIAPSLIGSVEFAVATYDTPLVVVMGHSRCGAVTATLDTILHDRTSATEHIHDIVERISPSVSEVLTPTARQNLNHEELLKKCITANVENSVKQLRHGSQLIEEYCTKGILKIVGAEYSLETGWVHFYNP